MAGECKTDKFGGEYKVVDGVEVCAMWLPVTVAEKEALIKKGAAEGVSVPALASGFLREWLKESELREGELEKVAGGFGGLAGPSITKLLKERLTSRQIRWKEPPEPEWGWDI